MLQSVDSLLLKGTPIQLVSLPIIYNSYLFKTDIFDFEFFCSLLIHYCAMYFVSDHVPSPLSPGLTFLGLSFYGVISKDESGSFAPLL